MLRPLIYFLSLSLLLLLACNPAEERDDLTGPEALGEDDLFPDGDEGRAIALVEI